jgi:hypothetical protein
MTKPLAIALNGVGRSWEGIDGGSNLTNMQYKATWNYHKESPVYNEYILIKMVKNL